MFTELALHTAGEIGIRHRRGVDTPNAAGTAGAGSVELQLRVGAADDADRRPLAIHSPTGRARGRVDMSRPRGAPQAVGSPQAQPATWPPRKAERLEHRLAYAEFAETGLEYGAVFRGLRAAWRRGDDIFAEVALPELGEVIDFGRYGIHPALLDAALHAMRYRYQDRPDRTMLPFAWHGVTLLRTGASALRVRITPVTADSVRIELADSAGSPVAVVESLVVRPIRPNNSADHEALFALGQVEVPLPDGPEPSVATCGDLADLPPGDAPEVVVLTPEREPDVTRAAGRALDAVQVWLADKRFDDSPAGGVYPRRTDRPGAAAVWGLIRAGAGGRGTDSSSPTWTTASSRPPHGPPTEVSSSCATARCRPRGCRECRAFRRDSRDTLAPRRHGADHRRHRHTRSVLARHLVVEHGVRNLVLTGRRGPDTPEPKRWRMSWPVTAAQSGSSLATSRGRDAWPGCWPSIRCG